MRWPAINQSIKNWLVLGLGVPPPGILPQSRPITPYHRLAQRSGVNGEIQYNTEKECESENLKQKAHTHTRKIDMKSTWKAQTSTNVNRVQIGLRIRMTYKI